MTANIAAALLIGGSLYGMVGFLMGFAVDEEGPDLAAWVLFWPLLGLISAIHGVYRIGRRIWSDTDDS